ncbi:sensor histidine kinase [Nonomuraea lactucae]|uniref:sensor histidine kinase n=1 Tax=Nonomuraea lactucae TaxID=2249762 RepID=UPI000DE51BD1|nr:ATP-binding protein [Nonomuraea lactucae]
MRGESGLAEAVESHLAQWSGCTGIRVETWALPAADVPARVTQAVLTALREALANVEHHSGARTVSIALTVGEGGLLMTVSDDGHGFDLVEAGSGIVRMRAAFTEVGGRLSVNSVQGGGTTVTGAVPRRA